MQPMLKLSKFTIIICNSGHKLMSFRFGQFFKEFSTHATIKIIFYPKMLEIKHFPVKCIWF